MKAYIKETLKFAAGVAIIVPCAIAGKFVGAGVGIVVGGMVAMGAGAYAVDYIAAKFSSDDKPLEGEFTAEPKPKPKPETETETETETEPEPEPEVVKPVKARAKRKTVVPA